MALTVEHLNADSTFLLTFAPSFAPSATRNHSKFPGSFRILIDPWLIGSSVHYHPKFASTRLTTPPAISSLAELTDGMDVIIISQDKTDHLSKETLCSLPADTHTTILATPKAAKKIRAWKHFLSPHTVQEMTSYAANKPEGIIRIPIESYSPGSAPGEVTVCNISEKRDLTGLHNGIAITYLPPGTFISTPNGSVVKLDDLPMVSHAREVEAVPDPDAPTPDKAPAQQHLRSRQNNSDFDLKHLPQQQARHVSHANESLPGTRTDSPHATTQSTSDIQATSERRVTKEKIPLANSESVLSILYTPHGLRPAALQPYLTHHLASLHDALPLTALFHAMNSETNPWWLGGTVLTGAPGGVELAGLCRAQYWISAHDEIKDNVGWATRRTLSRVYAVPEVDDLLRHAAGHGTRLGNSPLRNKTEVCVLASGESRRFTT